MKEWICEEVPALTVDGKVIDTMLLMRKELVRCHDCKHRSEEMYDYYNNPYDKRYVCQIHDIAGKADWFCPDGERKET